MIEFIVRTLLRRQAYRVARTATDRLLNKNRRRF